jgi:lysophospholipase L1-like esterase
MTRTRFLAFAVVAATGALVVILGVLLLTDIYVHHRIERYAGVNVWGYRGPRVGRKQPNEHRLVVIGGSTAFGYGVLAEEAFPAQLERDLQQVSKGGAKVTVVNLGMNSQGAYAFRFALEDYRSLDYDAAILYEGYNDMGDRPNEYVGRHESPIFRLTGYFPVLQIALSEKAMALRSGGDLESAYRGKTVFKPGVAARATAGALDTARGIGDALSKQLERASKVAPASLDYAHLHVSYVGCNWPWEHYCGSVYDAITYALAQHKRVLVVTQPYVSDLHREQQEELRTMLDAWFGSNPNVGYANLGDALGSAMIERNPRLVYDGLHLTREGNAIIARRLVAPTAALMPEAFATPSTSAE